jgi:hypothetical protein
MTLLTVVQDVCAVVGVIAPTSVFTNINANRTMFEMVACANEMANSIGGDERDWTALYKLGFGGGTSEVGGTQHAIPRLQAHAEERRGP